MAQLVPDTVKVDKLVKEFLAAQSLSILPQNSFGDAVAQYVDKDDKHAMEHFVEQSLATQLKHLMGVNDVDEEELQAAMDECKTELEKGFISGQLKKKRKLKYKPPPDTWDSDLDGPWVDQPAALIHADAEDDGVDEDAPTARTKKPTTRGRGGKAAGTTRQSAAATKKAPVAKKAAATKGRGKKVVEEEESEVDEDGDAIMISSGNDDESDDDLFVGQRAAAKKAAAKAPARAKSPAKKTPASRAKAPAAKQSTLNFSQSTQRSQAPRAAASRPAKRAQEISEEEISDDDAFEPPPSTRTTRRR
jgi:double-strand break repair protein MRE11